MKRKHPESKREKVLLYVTTCQEEEGLVTRWFVPTSVLTAEELLKVQTRENPEVTSDEGNLDAILEKIDEWIALPENERYSKVSGDLRGWNVVAFLVRVDPC
jgi:hypothetical protein